MLFPNANEALENMSFWFQCQLRYPQDRTSRTSPQQCPRCRFETFSCAQRVTVLWKANTTVNEELLLKTNLLVREVTRHNKICHGHAPNSTTQKPSILLFRTSNKPMRSQLYLEFQMLNTRASIRGAIFISSFQEEWSIESWQLFILTGK